MQNRYAAMISKKSGCLLLTLILVGALAVNAQENKTALLIANGAYATLGNLDQPVPEARQLRSVLQGIGFEVALLENASREQMADALIDFQRNLDKRGGTGFFHYGGHAVQVDGKNFLIPANANIPDEERVPSRSISLDEVARAIEASRASTSVIILDACRDNPLPRQSGRSAARGLSVVGAAPTGTIVVYSAQAGAVARDGVFTPALIRNLNKPVSFNEILQEVAREVRQATAGSQRPFSYADLTMPAIYLAGRASTGQPQVTVAPTPSFGIVTAATGSLTVKLESPGTLSVGGLSAVLPAGTVPVNNLSAGLQTVTVQYPDGKTESLAVTIPSGGTASLSFTYIPIPGWETSLITTLETLAINAKQSSLITATGNITEANSDRPGPFSLVLQDIIEDTVKKTTRLKLADKPSNDDFFKSSFESVKVLLSARYYVEHSNIRLKIDLRDLSDGSLFGTADTNIPIESIGIGIKTQLKNTSQKRVALIIGNGNYSSYTTLKTPLTDARDMAKILTDHGFNVSMILDADAATMNRAIIDFGNSIKQPDTVALFYFSGLGLRFNNVDYLLPTREDIIASKLDNSAIDIQKVYNIIRSAGNLANFVFIDAGRDNPFAAEERRTWSSIQAPPNSLVCFSTEPGKTALDGLNRNSDFTTTLLKHLFDPTIDIYTMIQRVQQDVNSSTGGRQVPSFVWRLRNGFSFTN